MTCLVEFSGTNVVQMTQQGEQTSSQLVVPYLKTMTEDVMLNNKGEYVTVVMLIGVEIAIVLVVVTVIIVVVVV